MKCPYRKITNDNGYNHISEEFAECYGKECPFFGKTVKEKRYEGGYNEIIKPVCRRAEKESEGGEK